MIFLWIPARAETYWILLKTSSWDTWLTSQRFFCPALERVHSKNQDAVDLDQILIWDDFGDSEIICTLKEWHCVLPGCHHSAVKNGDCSLACVLYVVACPSIFELESLKFCRCQRPKGWTRKHPTESNPKSQLPQAHVKHPCYRQLTAFNHTEIIRVQPGEWFGDSGSTKSFAWIRMIVISI